MSKLVSVVVLRVALSMLFAMAAVAAVGCTPTSAEKKTPQPVLEEPWIDAEMRAGMPPDDGADVTIDDVAVYREPNMPEDDPRTWILITGRVDHSSGAITAWEETSDPSIGPWRQVEVDEDGLFEAGYEYLGTIGANRLAKYEMAYVGGNRVFLDFDRGLWADEEGGDFYPITGWDEESTERWRSKSSVGL